MMPAKILTSMLAAMVMSGCVSVVEVRSDGAAPQLSFWPLGVRVERGDADAIAVRTRSLGVAYGCDAAVLGASDATCVAVDPKTCTFAAIFADSRTDVPYLKRIARAADVQCLNKGAKP